MNNFTVKNTWSTLAALIIAVTSVCAAFTLVSSDEASAWTCALSVDKAEITEGDAVTLSWDYSYPDAFVIDNGVGTITKDNSSTVVYPTANTTYTGTVTDKKGRSTTCSVVVKVKKPEPKYPACFMQSPDAWPKTIDEGQSTTISWYSINADGGYIKLQERKPLTTQVWKTYTGKFPVTGDITVTPTRNTDYVGVLYDKDGKKVDECLTEIDIVKKKNPSCDITADASTIDAGQSVKITWAVQNAASVKLFPSGSTVGLSGSKTFSPTTNTTYRVEAYDAQGTKIKDCETEVAVKTKNPQCDMTISTDRVTAGKGESITLSWSAQNVASARFFPGNTTVGLTDSKTFIPNESQTYTVKFYNTDGDEEVQCQKSVTVWNPPCFDCGGGTNQPRVELTQKYEPAGTSSLAFVTLTQIPYTGFEAGPIATGLFWTIVALWSIAIGYTLLQNGTWGSVIATFIPSPYANEVAMPAYSGMPNFGGSSRGTPPANLPGAAPKPIPLREERPQLKDKRFAGTGERNPMVVKIEEMAYGEKILLSLEAIDSISAMARRNVDEVHVVMQELVEKSKENFPRVDGWIHLTREKVHAVLPHRAVKTPAPAVPQETYVAVEKSAEPSVSMYEPELPITAPVQHMRPVEEVVSTKSQSHVVQPVSRVSVGATGNGKTDPAQFVAFIAGGAEEKAFAALRAHLSNGGSVQSLFADIAKEVDASFRNRIEGAPADRRVNEALARFDTKDVEGMLEIISNGLDYSYSSPATAGKITLMKLFEYTRSRTA